MRYKVKVQQADDFDIVCSAAALHAHVHVISKPRRTLSVGDLDDMAKAHLERLGATVEPEMRYDADAA